MSVPDNSLLLKQFPTSMRDFEDYLFFENIKINKFIKEHFNKNCDLSTIVENNKNSLLNEEEIMPNVIKDLPWWGEMLIDVGIGLTTTLLPPPYSFAPAAASFFYYGVRMHDAFDRGEKLTGFFEGLSLIGNLLATGAKIEGAATLSLATVLGRTIASTSFWRAVVARFGGGPIVSGVMKLIKKLSDVFFGIIPKIKQCINWILTKTGRQPYFDEVLTASGLNTKLDDIQNGISKLDDSLEQVEDMITMLDDVDQITPDRLENVAKLAEDVGQIDSARKLRAMKTTTPTTGLKAGKALLDDALELTDNVYDSIKSPVIQLIRQNLESITTPIEALVKRELNSPEGINKFKSYVATLAGDSPAAQNARNIAAALTPDTPNFNITDFKLSIRDRNGKISIYFKVNGIPFSFPTLSLVNRNFGDAIPIAIISDALDLKTAKSIIGKILDEAQDKLSMGAFNLDAKKLKDIFASARNLKEADLLGLKDEIAEFLISARRKDAITYTIIRFVCYLIFRLGLGDQENIFDAPTNTNVDTLTPAERRARGLDEIFRLDDLIFESNIRRKIINTQKIINLID